MNATAKPFHIGTVRLSAPLILAPMAGVCDLPYRVIAHRYGAALVCTEMVSDKGLLYNNVHTREMLRIAPEEHPVSMQIFGADPYTMAKAAASVEEAGADIVGMEDLAHEIKGGKMDFDVVIAEPAAMRVVGQLGQILGPRGLMPNPKVGTVTPNVAQAVKNAKAGQVQFRADKAGIIHAPVGRASFEVEQLLTNIKALIEQLNKIKPASTKGVYIRKVAVSSTMGPGVKVDVQTLN